MIEARELTKRFGRTLAVDHLSFDIRPGVVTGFLGPNGAGKSTTMRMMLGLDLPTSGGVRVHGRNYRDLPAPMREVGALLDAKAVDPKRTARRHLRWVARAGDVDRARVDEVLDLVGLTGVADRRVGGFSLGMSQRLGIATALLGDPGVLLFDEPVNGLDPEGIHWVRNLLRFLASEGRTVVVSSHLMSEMETTADQVLVIGKGRLLADTSIRDFTEANAGHRVRVVSPDAPTLAAHITKAGGSAEPDSDEGPEAGALVVSGLDAPSVGNLAAEHGLRIHELTPLRTSLEAAYLAQTEAAVEYRSGVPSDPVPSGPVPSGPLQPEGGA